MCKWCHRLLLGRQRTVEPTIRRLFLVASAQVLKSKTFTRRQNEEHVCKMYSFCWRSLSPPLCLPPNWRHTHDKMDCLPPSFLDTISKPTQDGGEDLKMGLGKQMFAIYNWHLSDKLLFHLIRFQGLLSPQQNYSWGSHWCRYMSGKPWVEVGGPR